MPLAWQSFGLGDGFGGRVGQPNQAKRLVAVKRPGTRGEPVTDHVWSVEEIVTLLS